ncbi:hypothetical protein LWI28_016271 [Acer negundo]|uniref:Uncharacterized protein n=1 Tax=Acer negundo TaxID=4023 RepID=A0AAD5J9T9_ACENE|nr:hypothetical protein LWI28_016271 [Acer negundo]
MLHGRDQGIKFSHPHFNHWTRGQEIADSDTHFNHWTRGQEIADSDSHFNRWTQLPDPEHPREVYRLWTVQLPDPEHPREVNRLWTTQLPDPEHPREDNRWFPWLKSKFGIKKRGESLAWLSERSAYTEINHLWEKCLRNPHWPPPPPERPIGWFPWLKKPDERSDAPKVQQWQEKLNEFKGKQVWTHDQENSDNRPYNVKLNITTTHYR